LWIQHTNKKEGATMKVTTVGVDLAKRVFQLHGVDQHGRVVLRKRLSRSKLAECLTHLPPCLIGMEACGGAHYWARKFQQMGHEVKLISPQFVKPYVKSNKNDSNDAEAICEAVSRPSMRFVPVKSVAQQDIQALHWIRERVIGERTALVNQTRGLLAEYGIVLPQGVNQVRKHLPFILEDAENGLTGLAREFFADLGVRLRELDEQVAQSERRIHRVFQRLPVCQKLTAVEGVGPLGATALVAAVGQAREFKNGRELAAWLGLVPRHHSTAGKTKLLGISKRGNRYLRKLLIHGGRAVVQHAQRKTDARSRWVTALKQRRGSNIAAVAVANKNARILWALLTRGEDYRKAA
jgi:transposase